MNIVKNKKAQAITQIVILLISIIAISWIIGSEVKEVSANGGDCPAGYSCKSPNLCTGTGDLKDLSGTCEIGSQVCCKKAADASVPTDSCRTGYSCTNQNLCTGTNDLKDLSGSCKTQGEICCKQGGDTTTTTSPVNTNPGPCGFFCDSDGKAAYEGKEVKGSCVKDWTKYEPCLNGCNPSVGCIQKINDKFSVIDGAKQGASILSAGEQITKAPERIKSLAEEVINSGDSPEKPNGFFNAMHQFLFGFQKETGEIDKAGKPIFKWTGVGGDGVASAIGSVVVWSSFAFLMGRYVLGPAFGFSVHNSQALGTALAAGMLTFTVTTSVPIMKNVLGFSGAVGGPVGIVIGIAVTAITLVFTWRNASADIIQLPCYQWEAQDGKEVGTIAAKKARCELCNKEAGDLPCTDYQCRSLGAGCELVNEEESGRQLCVWNNPNDINPPVIKPLTDALQDDFKYTPDNAISPPDRGVKIAYDGKEEVTKINGARCAPAYTRVSFGVALDEAAKCKISTVNQESYEKMNDIYMGRGIYDENQSFILSLPSKEALEAQNITVENGKNYSLYVRCQDKNGNSNIANFVFNFCINEGPDRTAPKIVGTDIEDGQPIGYNQASVPIQLYTNEPAECKWSFIDKEYDTMENEMKCNTLATDMNSQLLYTCKGNLNGLKNGQSNNYYFRCKDQPLYAKTDKESLRNTNKASYHLTLMGTRPLVIKSASPNNTIIEDSADVVKVELNVETFAGAKDGNAICSFSETGIEKSYVDFFYPYGTEPYSQYLHTQELWLDEGQYDYFIRCRDKGGNMDTKEIKFNVSTDTASPVIVRVFNEDNYLKIITNEPAECAYSTTSCNFDIDEETEDWDANAMSSEGDKSYADWNVNFDYYIKCKDEYGNRPAPNVCSITVRPFDILEAQ